MNIRSTKVSNHGQVTRSRCFRSDSLVSGMKGDRSSRGNGGLVWWALFSEPRQRLWAELKITEAKQRADAVPVPNGAQETAQDSTKKLVPVSSEREDLLAAAQFAQRRWCKEASWALLLSERRLAAADFNDKIRSVVATSLRSQAQAQEMKRSWRGKAVLNLVPDKGIPTTEALIEALLQVDSASNNKIRKLRTIRIELLLLTGALLSSVLAAIAYAYAEGIGEGVGFGNRRLLVLAPLFGVIGASLSSIQRASGERASLKVPEQRLALVTNLIRLGTGAGASLVVIAGLQTGTVATESVEAVLLACLAAGFSERFILRFLPKDEKAPNSPDSESSDAPTGTPPSEAEGPESYFRAGVGIVVVDSNGRVLALERSDRPGTWQCPQGGIKPGETPQQAADRELEEETGLTLEKVDFEGPLIDEWLPYELPQKNQSRKTGLGQVQKWFLYRARSDERPKVVRCRDSATQEVSDLDWMDMEALILKTGEFRRPTYERLRLALRDRQPKKP